MIVLPDYRFDVVVARGEQPLVLLRTCGMRRKVGFQWCRITDAVVHSPAVAIDQPRFFGRIQLRNRAHPGAYEESQVFVRCAVHIGVKKRRMFRIVNGRKHIRVHVVDRFALQECLRQSFRYFVAMPKFILPALQRAGGFGRRPSFDSHTGPNCENWSGVKRNTTSVKSSSAVGPPERRAISLISTVTTGLSVKCPWPMKTAPVSNLFTGLRNVSVPVFNSNVPTSMENVKFSQRYVSPNPTSRSWR